MVTIEFKADGYDYHDDDRILLNSIFSEVGLTRAEGQWAPAAGPPIELSAVITFFGNALAGILIEKALLATWKKFRKAWSKYREDRKNYSAREPELSSIRIRTSDMDIQMNMPINPDEFDLNAFLELVVSKLEHTQLAESVITSISLPSRKDSEGSWQTVRPEEYCNDDNVMVWWLQGSSVNGPWIYYDAENDIILSDR